MRFRCFLLKHVWLQYWFCADDCRNSYTFGYYFCKHPKGNNNIKLPITTINWNACCQLFRIMWSMCTDEIQHYKPPVFIVKHKRHIMASISVFYSSHKLYIKCIFKRGLPIMLKHHAAFIWITKHFSLHYFLVWKQSVYID